MNILKKIQRNEQDGVTLAEILIGMAISSALLIAVFKIFIQQQSAFENLNDSTLIRAKGRLAIKLLSKEIRMAGHGMPKNTGIIDFDSTSITFYVGGVSTTTPPGSAGTKAVADGDTTLNVVSATGFGDGNNVVIHDPALGTTEFVEIEGTPETESNPNTIPLKEAVTKDFIYGVNSNLVTVTAYNTVKIYLNGSNVVKTVDGQEVTVIQDVSSGDGLSFDFYGAADTAAVEKVGITMKLIDPSNSRATINLKSDITLRNQQS